MTEFFPVIDNGHSTNIPLWIMVDKRKKRKKKIVSPIMILI